MGPGIKPAMVHLSFPKSQTLEVESSNVHGVEVTALPQHLLHLRLGEPPVDGPAGAVPVLQHLCHALQAQQGPHLARVTSTSYTPLLCHVQPAPQLCRVTKAPWPQAIACVYEAFHSHIWVEHATCLVENGKLVTDSALCDARQGRHQGAHVPIQLKAAKLVEALHPHGGL